MRVRVKFRYRADTGEVEVFRVEDTSEGAPAADHDVRHDRITADVARIVENNALIEQEAPQPVPLLQERQVGQEQQARQWPAEEEPSTGRAERGQRLHD